MVAIVIAIISNTRLTRVIFFPNHMNWLANSCELVSSGMNVNALIQTPCTTRRDVISKIPYTARGFLPTGPNGLDGFFCHLNSFFATLTSRRSVQPVPAFDLLRY
jgi:hypothetical protein